MAQTASAALALVRRLGEPSYGPARLLVVGPSGTVRIVDLPRIHAGAKPGTRQIRRDALTADPSGRRAFVVGGGDEPAAAIDLRTLAVTYHRLLGVPARPRPSAVQRDAAWVGGGVLALVGDDEVPGGVRSIGPRLVDTRTWRTRLVDREGGFMTVVDGRIVVQHAFGTVVVFDARGALGFTVTIPDSGGFVEVTGNGRHLYLNPYADGTVYRIDPGIGWFVDPVRRPQIASLLASAS